MIRCSPLIILPFPLKTFCFRVFSSVFFSYPISTSVFSVTGVSHFHPGMDQKLAVSTFPTHELDQNIMVFNCGWKAMKNKHKGNS